MVGEGILSWVRDLFLESDSLAISSRIVNALVSEEELDRMWQGLTEEQRNNPATQSLYSSTKEIYAARTNEIVDPFTDMIASWIDTVKTIAEKYHFEDPATALDQGASLAKDMLGLNTAVQALEFGLGALPNGMGVVAATKTQSMWNWLGFGAVLNAMAHDPVKIALLRPWNASLEAIYRNRRLEHVDVINAYLQRSLSPTTITDIDQITDGIMDQIEEENHTVFFEDLAKHGFADPLIATMEDASTRALNFSALSRMASMGHYNRKLAIFSLWTDGMDRRVMYPALEALETMRDVGLWKGFRSMVEPAYVQGLIEETDLREYWTRILVPGPVQDWTILKLTKARVKFLEKEQKQLAAADKSVTEAKITKAYKLKLISKDELTAYLQKKGYDAQEIDLLIRVADAEMGPTSQTACKRLPLSDYELAHRNGIVTTQQIVERMTGEYCPADIALEVQLLAIDDLTSEAPLAEKDLAASTVSTAYVDGIISPEFAREYWARIGYDEAETTILFELASLRKQVEDAKKPKDAKGKAVAAERDLTLAQLTQAFVQNVLDESTYQTDIQALGYDSAEVAILLQLARIRKKLPEVTGMKRLPLSDYEKAYEYDKIKEQDVLDRMKGEYTDYDIGLEKMMMAAGIARKR